jgi:hypothetical protein
MSVLKTPPTLVDTGSSLIYPRLDGFESWPEPSGSLGRPGTWPIVMQSDFDRKAGGDGSARFLPSITTDLL